MLGTHPVGKRGVAATLGLLTVLSVSLVTAAAAPAAPQAPANVGVVLSEWKLVTSLASIKAGKVTFLVKNDGTLDHELVVLRTDAHHHAIATKGGQAVEKDLVGEIANIAPGQSRGMTVSLKRGTYVVLCNLLGHYRAGQYAALRVS